jgi:hypothetical protein
VRIETRLEKLERRADVTRFDLTCPECGQRFMLYADPLDILTAEWVLRAGGGSSGMGEDVDTVVAHEHNPWDFVEKRSGLPFGEVAGGAAYAGRVDAAH